MLGKSFTATAHPNIALIKYWGDLDPHLHIPANGSISMNLAELTTRTRVSFDPSLSNDLFSLNGEFITGAALERVIAFLNHVREMAGKSTFARVESYNNFPIGVGIASSAAGFAALSLAATCAAGLELDEQALSRLARLGSGSACRSIPGGFVEWQAGHQDHDSYAYSIAPPEHWDLVDCIAIISQEEKSIGSSTGHYLAATSPLQASRVQDAPRRLGLCREAIMKCDFQALAEIVEFDSNLMHAVMITSRPPLLYWQAGTVEVMQAVRTWRSEGLPVCFSIDAGPNVHVIAPAAHQQEVAARLGELPGVREVLIAHIGGRVSFEEPVLSS